MGSDKKAGIGPVAVCLEGMLNFWDRHSRWWSGLAGGYLLGLIANAVSDPALRGPTEVLVRLFSPARPVNAASWVAAAILISMTCGRVVLRSHIRRQSYEHRLARLYRDRVSSELYPFQRGHIAWGDSLTLQSGPDLRGGWPAASVRILYDLAYHTLPADLEGPYGEFLEGEFRQRFSDDRTRLMLTRNPISFSDQPTLRLYLQRTTWSQLRFYQDRVLATSTRRIEHITKVLAGPISFPNSLSLLMVVATSDGYILLTQTSDKVHYYPGYWACSIGEHLDEADLTGSDARYVLNWVDRALSEELGVPADAYLTENARIMAVIMEAQIVNFSLVGVVVLKYDRATLDALIDKHPRTDYEFQDWTFIPWDRLPHELQVPSRPYHPSTGLRMLYGGMFKFGPAALHRRLLALEEMRPIKRTNVPGGAGRARSRNA